MPKLLIIVQGGCVVGLHADSPIEVKIIDFDTNLPDEDDIDQCYPLDRQTPEGYDEAEQQIREELNKKRKELDDA